MKEKIIKFLDNAGFWDGLVWALGAVGKGLFWAWCVVLALVAVALGIAGLFFNAWWLLAFVPWLVLLVLTVAVWKSFIEDSGW